MAARLLILVVTVVRGIEGHNCTALTETTAAYVDWMLHVESFDAATARSTLGVPVSGFGGHLSAAYEGGIRLLLQSTVRVRAMLVSGFLLCPQEY